MPELPEVETVVRGLRSRLMGQIITRVEVRQSPTAGLVRGNLRRFRQTLRHATIGRLHRRAKYILVELHRGAEADPAHTWIVHLGMTGQLYACKPQAERLKHTHLILDLSSGEQVRLCDPRRFGKTLVLPTDRVPEFLSHAGPDPLEISPEDFTGLLAGRKAPIKNLLLNQTLLSGLGNIYANEALFLAGIHPATPAGRLRAGQAEVLHRVIRRVLREAIAGNGTTISDYRTAEGAPGGYQNRLRVYGREGEPCPRCGALIKRLVLAQRSAHYCPVCQPRGRRKVPKKVGRKSRRTVRRKR